MVYEFDVKIFCQNLKATKPPYECPVKGCGKVYKSYSGIQFHLYNYDHDNPDNNVASPVNKKSFKKKNKWHHRQNRRSPTPPEFVQPPKRDPLTYAEAQRLVEVDVDGKIHRINIYEPLEIISQDQIDNHDNTEKEEKLEKTPAKGVKHSVDTPKGRKDPSASSHDNKTVKLPEAQFKIVEEYIKPENPPHRPNSYFRYIEKSVEELDEEVEYDMDEEDHAWLTIMNEKRKDEGLNAVNQEDFELLMDRFEKEAFFQSQTSGHDMGPPIDEDAVCTICMDGECQNSNVILFCDMCNIAVHQECYGVPYIPEGQWLCRRCLQSPSRAVDCCLCPNKGGAFKQTDDGRWAHVVCSLWIPEVGFANTVFLEPIDSIERIPPARWKLSCYICKQRGTGACIQCHKTNCYTAFHVTCAQQAGLYMKIEPCKEPNVTGSPSMTVRKTAYCDVHTPADSDCTPMLADSSEEDRGSSAKKAKEKSRLKMRKARKILAEKRNAMPVVSIPIIPQHRLNSLGYIVNLAKKQQFVSRLASYWTLKRQSRNGVPLLRRLQSSHMTRNKDQASMTKNDKQSNALKEQLKYWQRLRQDLEKARLLVELIRKREKLKREQVMVHQKAIELELEPFAVLLRNTLDQIQEKDSNGIFAEPVSLEEVPDYLKYIKTPMDFSTIRNKINSHKYKTMDDFEVDFETIITNCQTYNAKDTMFYRAAVKLRDQGGSIIRASRRMAERVGYDPDTGLHLEKSPADIADPIILEDFDTYLAERKDSLPLEEQLRILLDKMDMANAQKKGSKHKLAKRIKMEVMKVRRKLAIQKGQHLSDFEDEMDTDQNNDSAIDDSHAELDCSPKDPKSPKHKTQSKGNDTPSKKRGRTKSKGTRHSSSKSESETEQTMPKTLDERRLSDSSRTTESSICSKNDDSNSSNHAQSGVNRRTAVLFSKKSARNKQDNSNPSSPNPSPKKATHKNTKRKSNAEARDSPQPPVLEPMSPSSRSRGPGSPISRKRSSSAVMSPEKEGRPSPPKRTMSLTEGSSMSDPPDLTNKESFMVYRGPDNLRSSSDSDSTSIISSSDDSLSETSSNTSSSNSRSDINSNGMPKLSEEGTESESSTSSPNSKRKARAMRSTSCDSDDLIPLEPLDLVWAKCRGYPWYPALIINPKMPKTGYFHNGVPIPVPPEDVLALQRKYDEPVYLILFFDTKRTWQWLPRNKLEPLGVDSGLDKAKLLENRKPNVRKAVQKAYEKAILHRCSVTGEPNPLSEDSEIDEQ